MLPAGVGKVADAGQTHDRHATGGRDRIMPGSGPQSELTARRMTSDDDLAAIGETIGGVRNQPGKNLNRSRDILEGPWPTAASLANFPVLRRADNEPVVSQGISQRPRVRSVVSGPPESAVQEDNKRRPPVAYGAQCGRPHATRSGHVISDRRPE